MSISAMKYALDVLDNYVEDPRCEAHRATAVHFLEQAIAEAEKPDLARVGEVGVWGDKREWVGLATGEAREFYESDLSREELIHKIDEFLQEKNT
jgi:hypothetical protein